MQPSAKPKVVCREIVEDDFDAVVACLQRGFPGRPQDYWKRALNRMAQRPAIGDYPRFGYALFVGSDVVGVQLLIFSLRDAADHGGVVGNLSSWCVDEEYRSHSLALHMKAVKRPDVTYLNISPAMHTRKMIEALGFRPFSQGQTVVLPILSTRRSGVRVVAFAADRPEAALLTASERDILADHAALGCRALICLEMGLAYPFVFQPRAIVRNRIPCPHLIYCRDMSDFVRFAHAIGRYLMLRTGPLCVVDATGPAPGLVGRYFPGRLSPKYFKGPAAPGLGDLAYSELVVLGP